MRIPSSDIPQADKLADVVLVVKAVKKEKRTFQEIARYLGKVDRQGRYYRRAAEILGFIRNERNEAVLTRLGEELLNASPAEQNDLLLSSVLGSRLFQRMLPFFETRPEGVTKTELQNFMAEVTEQVGPSMMPRRVSTVLGWLETLHVLKKQSDRYRFSCENLRHMKLIEFSDTEPLLPSAKDLKEYEIVEKRTNTATALTSVMRDQAAFDRANHKHTCLVNLVAERLRSAGILPKYNQLIDLAARVNARPYIFEMKSTTPDNARSQIRHGLSQLYEYRYLQNLPDATLVLVIEKPLPEDVEWMSDYLEADRDIRLLWNGNDELHSSLRTREEMSFLWEK